MNAPRRSVLSSVALIAAMSAPRCAATPAAKPPPIYPPVGGANSPEPTPPPKLAIRTGVLNAGAFSVKVPTGSYEAPRGGAPNHTVPGPIVAFRGADATWRGHGYLDTCLRLLKFQGKLTGNSAHMSYSFQGGRSYEASLRVGEGAVLLEEHSALGPRNVYVFDCYYGGWQPAAAFAVNRAARHHAFLYLPCYYDRAEVTINPAAPQPKAERAAREAKGQRRHGEVVVMGAVPAARAPGPDDQPGAVAVLSADSGKRDTAGFFCRNVAGWKNGDRMGIQLWQRRQLPGDPASRHFLGPETKSDSTPNPRTAGLLGRSLYEGHVTIELSLGVGSRQLGFAVTAKPARKKNIPEAFKKIMRANQ